MCVIKIKICRFRFHYSDEKMLSHNEHGMGKCFLFFNTFFGPNTTAKPTNAVGKLKCECPTYILTHTHNPGRCGTKRSRKDPQYGASATHTNIRKAHAIFLTHFRTKHNTSNAFGKILLEECPDWAIY